MNRIDDSLNQLEGVWDSLPTEVRAAASEAWGGAVVLLGQGCKAVGPALGQLTKPVVRLVFAGFQEHAKAATMAAITKRPAPDSNPVFEAVERKFPQLVAYLKMVTEAVGLSDGGK